MIQCIFLFLHSSLHSSLCFLLPVVFHMNASVAVVRQTKNTVLLNRIRGSSDCSDFSPFSVAVFCSFGILILWLIGSCCAIQPDGINPFRSSCCSCRSRCSRCYCSTPPPLSPQPQWTPHTACTYTRGICTGAYPSICTATLTRVFISLQ